MGWQSLDPRNWRDILAPHPHIIITGPQRSGTTIAGYMIARDLGYWFYPEEQIRVWELWRVRRLFRKKYWVLQAPAICRYVDQFDAAIVLMRRDVGDILASEKRVNWEGQERELRQYGLREGVIAEVKYQFWEEHQRDRIEHAFEVEYESLRMHPLWVEERSDFGSRQIRIGEIQPRSTSPGTRGDPQRWA